MKVYPVAFAVDTMLVPPICKVTHGIFSHESNELLEQLSIQLYRYLPGPSIPPKLPSDLAISIELSIRIESVSLQNVNQQWICKISFALLSTWPLTDPRVMKSKLVAISGGGIQLDSDRVWHPRLTVVNALRVTNTLHNLELRVDLTNPTGLATGAINRGVGSLAPKSTPIQQLGNLASKSDPMGGGGGDSSAPHYALIERFTADLPCEYVDEFSHIGAVVCPIHLDQDGFGKNQPNTKWVERKSCTQATDVIRRTFHVSLTKIFGDNIDPQGSDQRMKIQLCFSLISYAIKEAILPAIIVIISLIVLWNSCFGSCEASWIQLFLLFLSILTWLWLDSLRARTHADIDPFTAWCILCSLSVSLIVCLTLAQQCWFCRVLERRRRRFARCQSAKNNGGITSTSSNNDHVGSLPPVGPPTMLNGPGCFQGCACGSSCGGDIGKMNGLRLGGNGSGFASPNTETYGESYLCANGGGGSDSGHGGMRWRPVGGLRSGLDLNDHPPCHTCQSMPIPIQSLATIHSPAPPYSSCYSGFISPVCESVRPSNCCASAVRMILTILLPLIGAIFWIVIVSQGTIPEPCLGQSMCQPVEFN